MKKSMCPQCTGGGHDESHINKAVTQYSSGYKPNPSKGKSALQSALREVFTNKPSTVKTSASPQAQRKQMIAIAYSKARASGARLPKR